MSASPPLAALLCCGILGCARQGEPSGPILGPDPPPAQEFAFSMAGVALPLHAKDPTYDYSRELDEIAGLGATWVSLVRATRQERIDSSRVPLTSAWTPSPGRVSATIAHARALGLEVLLMPLVLLEHAGPDDWRGRLRPADPEEWWRTYGEWILDNTRLAEREGAGALCVGSELASLEHEEARWRRLIADVRAEYSGRLTYSANWDHFEVVSFWDALDFAGLSAYFELASGERPTAVALEQGWCRARAELERFAALSRSPIVLTEVGLPSARGAAARPWDHVRSAEPDLRVQRDGFAALRATLFDARESFPALRGVFLYDWWGGGGPNSQTYTARGKPAEEVWRALLADVRER